MKKALNRQTQHKSSKESKELSKKFFYEIKAENRKLKREINRLKKQLERRLIGPDSEVEELEINDINSILDSPKEKCPNCSGIGLSELELGIGKFIICKDCKWRKKI